MLEKLAVHFKEKGYYLEEAKVFDNPNAEFWHTTVLDKLRNPISAGFSCDKKKSRQVAISEYLERTAYREIAASDMKTRQEWGIDIIPTACGFAAGFVRKNTAVRSIAEACERWVMSKWIDEQLKVEKIEEGKILRGLDPASTFFVSQFDHIQFFYKTVLVEIGGTFLKINVAQTMAYLEGGIFPGSSAQYSLDGNIWQHALLESFRHYLLVKNNKSSSDQFPENKIRFFSKNAPIATKQIENATKESWPIPQIILHRCEEQLGEQFYIARTIMDGWRSWSEGPIERFLY